MQDRNSRQTAIRLGAHGEDYGNWMPVSMLRLVGGLLFLTVVLAALSFTVFRLTVLGVIFVIAAVVLLVLLCWITWIRRQYAFGGGGMMERVHHTILSHLNYNGKGTLLDKTTPRLIQFHIFKNAVNPPFLGGFSIFATVAA